MINIVKEHPAFDEVIIALNNSFLELNISSKISANIDNTRKNIVFGCHSRPIEQTSKFPKDTIIFNLEKLFDESQWLNNNYKKILSNFKVLDYSLSNVKYIKNKFNNQNVHYLRLGHNNILTNLKQDHSKEDIDVYFYGSMRPRRVSIIDQLKKMGINVVSTCDYNHNNRDKLIQRSKIILNIHCYLTGEIEIVRILPLLANSKCVISELHNGCSVYPGLEKSCVFCDYDQIITNIIEYLKDDKKRYNQELVGYETTRKHLMIDYLRPLLPIILE